jgi:hypothetical protein
VTFSDWLAMLWRRRVVVAAVLLCTMAGLVLVHHRNIQFESCDDVALTAPKSVDAPNVYINQQASLIATATILSARMMEPSVQQQMTASGLTASYDVVVFNSGSEGIPAYLEPLVTECSASYNPAMALDTEQGLAKLSDKTLRSMQATAGKVSKGGYINAQVIVPISVVPILGESKQAYLGLLVAGLLAAIGLAGWSDAFLRRRAARRRQPPAGPGAGRQSTSRREKAGISG